MRNEFAKWEIKTSVFSGRKSQAGNYWGQLKIIGLGPVVRDTFRIGHFEPLFAIYDDEASALKAFH